MVLSVRGAGVKAPQRRQVGNFVEKEKEEGKCTWVGENCERGSETTSWQTAHWVFVKKYVKDNMSNNCRTTGKNGKVSTSFGCFNVIGETAVEMLWKWGLQNCRQ